MTKPVSLVLIGIGGYGNHYVKLLLEDNAYKGHYEIAGVVDPYPENCTVLSSLVENEIPIFSSIDKFYASHKAEFAIISTPIHLHSSQICLALENGSHVLCEKPLCPTIEEAKQIIDTMKRTGNWVQIGFNWSFTDSIQGLKADINAGLFGKPKQLKSIVLWPRPEAYFQRSSWAGRIKAPDGTVILDSVASNATAHFLHNMFYVLGSKENESTQLESLTAELYRATPIENYDTCAVRLFTENQVEILFYATHAVKESLEPTFVYEFEEATIRYTKGNPIEATFKTGAVKTYEDPENHHFHKLWRCLDWLCDDNYEDGICGPQAAVPHVLSINAIQESASIHDFPSDLIRKTPVDNTTLTWVDGLSNTLIDCYEKGLLPSELGVDWSKQGKRISLLNGKVSN